MGRPFLGEIRVFAFNTAPAGWVPCEGQILPIAGNHALYSVLGTTYGGAPAGGYVVRQFGLPRIAPVPAPGGSTLNYCIAPDGAYPGFSRWGDGVGSPILGEVRAVPYEFRQEGWAPCQGQILPIIDHTALFALFGGIFGGDGNRTFALPKLDPLPASDGPPIDYYIATEGVLPQF